MPSNSSNAAGVPRHQAGNKAATSEPTCQIHCYLQLYITICNRRVLERLWPPINTGLLTNSLRASVAIRTNTAFVRMGTTLRITQRLQVYAPSQNPSKPNIDAAFNDFRHRNAFANSAVHLHLILSDRPPVAFNYGADSSGNYPPKHPPGLASHKRVYHPETLETLTTCS